MRLKLIGLTILLTSVGAFTFLLCLVYKIYAAASWNFLTGVLNLLTTHIIFLKLRNKLTHWYGLPELESFVRLGFVFVGAAVVGTVYHFVYYCLALRYFPDVDVTLWLPFICSFVTGLSAFLHCYWVDREQREF